MVTAALQRPYTGVGVTAIAHPSTETLRPFRTPGGQIQTSEPNLGSHALGRNPPTAEIYRRLKGSME
jgi:hypothetical protein